MLDAVDIRTDEVSVIRTKLTPERRHGLIEIIRPLSGPCLLRIAIAHGVASNSVVVAPASAASRIGSNTCCAKYLTTGTTTPSPMRP